MFELFLIGYLSYRNGIRARIKGLNPFLWASITLISYIAFYMAGIYIVLFYFCRNLIDLNSFANINEKARESLTNQLVQIFQSHPLDMVTIEIIGIGGYLFVRYLIDRKKGIPQGPAATDSEA